MPSPTIPSQELTVELGGHPHFVDVSGSTADGTVLLVCHGGPGYSELAMVRSGAYAALQERVIVITWDQRGTARSFNETISPATMTMDQLTADTIELATWVRNRFSCDKVHILGHSAGGTLALLAAHGASSAVSFGFCSLSSREHQAECADHVSRAFGSGRTGRECRGDRGAS